jgi:hypothetical protein
MSKTKLAFAASLFALVGAAQAAIPANITLSPYCDQLLNLTTNGSGGVTGIWAELTPCGVGADVAAGGPTAKGMYGSKKGYVLNTDAYPSYGGYFLFVVNADTTWYAVDLNGVAWAGGNWVPAIEGVKPTGRPLMEK